MTWLLFIDTNILLDFYRMEGGDAAQRQLDFINSNHDKIITSNQVQMEFMKHRQRIIIDTINRIKGPDGSIKQMPPVLVDAMPVKQIKKNLSQIKSQQKRVRVRIQKMLENPSRSDSVFKCAQRLFRNGSALNMDHRKNVRYKVRRAAIKRYMLGYPPRKKNDVSIGDAVNWEWIIRCASENSSDVLIVSRDQDYGPTHQKSTYINDWLAQEFRERVGKRRKVLLTNRLTEAMDTLKVRVRKDDKDVEERLLDLWLKLEEPKGEWVSRSKDDDNLDQIERLLRESRNKLEKIIWEWR